MRVAAAEIVRRAVARDHAFVRVRC
jgi:hypothetical protein